MTESIAFDPVPQLVEETQIDVSSVRATLRLLEEGNTVPFIARYRKEVTNSLDEVQIRTIEERHTYIMELEQRRQSILASIQEQGKLTDELKARLLTVRNKAELEDLYLPYKPKRRTRAIIARERGLAPLADRILEQALVGDPETEAAAFVDAEKEVPSTDKALQGARDIVAEILAEDADVRALVRERFLKEGTLVTEVTTDFKEQTSKFEQYYDFKEAVHTIPSHRFLAIQRGEKEGALRAKIDVDVDPLLFELQDKMQYNSKSPFAEQMVLAVKDGYKRLIAPSVETDVRVELKMRSDRDAVDIFANNLRNLLLASPLGEKSVIGIDPGLRTGCKCVAVDQTGKFLGNITIYPATGDETKASRDLLAFLTKYPPFAIAIGNGTGGRETEGFVKKLLKSQNLRDIILIQVNEAGASVYSASDVAREEFPDLDLTIRGAISIARRLQDPLAELVKVDPKSIGVGQYQHDVYQPLLQKKLDEVVESCVNQVGVEVNTASAPLLAYVAGVGPSLSKKIVKHREQNGPFSDRKALLKVSGLGAKTYEQAAGFLRVRGSKHPLDASAVHPERYGLVEQMASDMGADVSALIGNLSLIQKIEIKRYISDDVGEPTLRDIIEELKKPGRDPRTTFEAPKFRDDVNEMEDLSPGMQLEGVVTNVTAFGAFVDVGVHQDGLVHISELSDQFVKDPNEIVQVGQKLSVRVLEVDLARRRIALSARSGEGAPRAKSVSDELPDNKTPQQHRGKGRNDRNQRNDRGKPNDKNFQSGKFTNNPFASLLKK
ncbi:MAG: RNA-binding transcriptional accessory protein [Myxococcales bacterium]|nr:RNA-binding transcriptional accessory protein [Myxococcales bacterium]MCB9642896.1 RNA-binding transcriptional accessory protein [Myxococcales bacterium]